jgi:hypothetical protein
LNRLERGRAVVDGLYRESLALQHHLDLAELGRAVIDNENMVRFRHETRLVVPLAGIIFRWPPEFRHLRIKDARS